MRDGWPVGGEVPPQASRGSLSTHLELSCIRRTVLTRPATSEAIAPYGTLLTTPNVPRDGRRASFSTGLGPLVPDAQPYLSMSRIRRTPRRQVAVAELESHPYSSQTFIPLDVSRWLVVVAPKAVNGEPDEAMIGAFLLGPNQGITYSAGTWHHQIIVLDRGATFAIFWWRTGRKEDTAVAKLSTTVSIGLR